MKGLQQDAILDRKVWLTQKKHLEQDAADLTLFSRSFQKTSTWITQKKKKKNGTDILLPYFRAEEKKNTNEILESMKIYIPIFLTLAMLNFNDLPVTFNWQQHMISILKHPSSISMVIKRWWCYTFYFSPHFMVKIMGYSPCSEPSRKFWPMETRVV